MFAIRVSLPPHRQHHHRCDWRTIFVLYTRILYVLSSDQQWRPIHVYRAIICGGQMSHVGRLLTGTAGPSRSSKPWA